MTLSESPKVEQVQIEQRGPWPFVTRRVCHHGGGHVQIWDSRSHRKRLLVRGIAEGERLGAILVRCLWMPNQLNWWIGIIFSLGAILFALASILSLWPSLGPAWDPNQVNAIFFAGSIPFTLAAYLQLFQAANAGEFHAESSPSIGPDQGSQAQKPQTHVTHLHWFGWRLHNAGWLSCALQFVGTLLFNINTLDAMLPSLNWFQQDLLVWAPNIVGSTLFLASGYLAFIEYCHAYWALSPRELSWWVVFVNLLGCIFFMISSVLAVALPATTNQGALQFSVFSTLLGAIAFLFGSLLMLPESLGAETAPRPSDQSVT